MFDNEGLLGQKFMHWLGGGRYQNPLADERGSAGFVRSEEAPAVATLKSCVSF